MVLEGATGIPVALSSFKTRTGLTNFVKIGQRAIPKQFFSRVRDGQKEPLKKRNLGPSNEARETTLDFK
jgi:hypothetical protein